MKTPHLGQIAKASEIGKRGHNRYQWHACTQCGKQRWVVILKDGILGSGTGLCKKCGLIKPRSKKRGPNSPAWKGGRGILKNGYVAVYLPHGHKFEAMCHPRQRRVPEHRLVMAEAIGRPLGRYEFVHHKDGNRANNLLENLELTTPGKHSKDHSKGYVDGFEKGYADGLAKALQNLEKS